MSAGPDVDLSGSEGTTVTEVLAAYAEGGFDSSFEITDDSQLRCLTCQAVVAPDTVAMSSLRRMEGESDPDDMLAIVAITCPACGARGTSLLAFGPNATAQDHDVLRGLRDERGDGHAPGNSAHGETTGDDST